MEDILSKLEASKRERIINSALKEFSLNGYQKASTNTIVKNAKISKGLLFHYFGNKKDLYKSLESFVILTIKESIVDNINWNETDFFNRLQEVSAIKMALTKRYPYIYEFSTEIFKGKSAKDMKALTDGELGELTQKIYTHNISFDKFKDGLDMKKTMNIIRWTIEQLSEDLWKDIDAKEGSLDINEINEEAKGYFEALKKAFYKEDKEDQND